MTSDILKQPQTCSPLECYALSCLTHVSSYISLYDLRESSFVKRQSANRSGQAGQLRSGIIRDNRSQHTFKRTIKIGANHNAGSLFHTLRLALYYTKPFGTQFYPVIAMRFNPVYLVLGLLSMVYAAPVDPGSELGSHSISENTRRAPVVYNKNIVYIRFTGNHAQSANLKPPLPPPIIQTLVHHGLKKNFEEMTNNPHWIIHYDNEFVPLQWTSDTHDGLSLLLIYGLIYGVIYVRKPTFYQSPLLAIRSRHGNEIVESSKSS
ncbi:hypothetical protein C8J55DRAFT_493624 [Lentinula edodes]|uniref:Uncharacterized protein n=1 Tax=Lentinula lateritia TaxID=40482 RepID=A0A9W8ZRL4_9AGAR|nr:hypothetical protein C8J55DRAFT_493624 [Lentinula edodes]